MFLKNHKVRVWMCCLLGSLCLAGGALLLCSALGHRESYPYAEEAAEVATEWETTFATAWEEADDGSEETYVIEEEPLQESALLSEGLLCAAAVVLMLLGLVFSIRFVFFSKKESPFPGAETEAFLLFLSVLSLSRLLFEYVAPLYRVAGLWVSFPLNRAAGLWFSFFLLLVSARGLAAWGRHRLSVDWCAGHLLGMAAVGDSGKKSRYLLALLLWGILSLFVCAGALFLFVCGDAVWAIQWGALCALPGLGGLLGLFLSALCLRRFVKDMDHLSQQLRRAYEGEPVFVGNGVFSGEEETLASLDRQREEAVQKAVTGERFRVDLISNVSHDLRTPLTAILGYGELLKKEKLSCEGARQLAELNRKAGYMGELVEELFELTKVSSGAEKSRMEEIDLIRLLEQTIGLFDDQLQERRLQVRRHYEREELPIVTDGARMHQVFANLIGNAIKYALSGTRIHLEVRGEGEECSVRLTNIASYEMDFSPEEIVQRFVRGDKARTSRGSGIGLAIAQTYTESVGGTFRVDIDGEQFSATVTLPFILKEI